MTTRSPSAHCASATRCFRTRSQLLYRSMMRSTLVILAALTVVAAQGPGNGISKSTLAASHPKKDTYPWLMKYLPVNDADDSCPNNVCECGACGRVELKQGPDDQPSNGFGIHTVLAAGVHGARANASGQYSVADLEAIFDRKVLPAIGAGRTDPWMDYHLALYVPDLSAYTTPFKADKITYLPIVFNGTNGKSYPSLYVHIPHSQIVFLLVSPSTGADDDAHWTDSTAHARGVGETLDFSATGGEPPLTQPGLAKPLHVSRAVADVSVMVEFYTTVFGVSPTSQSAIPGGGKLLTYVLPSSKVAIRYVERPEAKLGANSTAWWQSYLNAVNKHYQTSYKSCWPIWGDNHYCYDSASVTDGQVAAIYEKNKGKPGYVYHAFRNPGGGGCNGYFGDPSGWQYQLDSSWEDCPADAEAFSPSYCTKSCVGAPPMPPGIAELVASPYYKK